MDDLVERLRSGRWLGETTGAKAADLIEAQAAEIRTLRATVDQWERMHDGLQDVTQALMAERDAEVAEIATWIRTKAIRAWGADATGRDETQFIADAIERREYEEPRA